MTLKGAVMEVGVRTGTAVGGAMAAATKTGVVIGQTTATVLLATATGTAPATGTEIGAGTGAVAVTATQAVVVTAMAVAVATSTGAGVITRRADRVYRRTSIMTPRPRFTVHRVPLHPRSAFTERPGRGTGAPEGRWARR